MWKFKEKVLGLAEDRARYIGKVTLIDKALEVLFLGLIPKSVTPNHITVFRFISIPFIIILLLDSHYLSATILFLFSAFSGALDGALARTSGQITRWRFLAVPFAD